MNALRRRLKPTVWIALLAIWAMAVLPTVSHALAHARGASLSWAEVCTPQGMRLVALPTDEQPAAGTGTPLQAAGHLAHCAFCTLALDAPVLPPAVAPVLWLPLPRADVPALFLHAPRTLYAWRSAQPRGPPKLS